MISIFLQFIKFFSVNFDKIFVLLWLTKGWQNRSRSIDGLSPQNPGLKQNEATNGDHLRHIRLELLNILRTPPMVELVKNHPYQNQQSRVDKNNRIIKIDARVDFFPGNLNNLQEAPKSEQKNPEFVGGHQSQNQGPEKNANGEFEVETDEFSSGLSRLVKRDLLLKRPKKIYFEVSRRE